MILMQTEKICLVVDDDDDAFLCIDDDDDFLLAGASSLASVHCPCRGTLFQPKAKRRQVMEKIQFDHL